MRGGAGGEGGNMNLAFACKQRDEGQQRMQTYTTGMD